MFPLMGNQIRWLCNIYSIRICLMSHHRTRIAQLPAAESFAPFLAETRIKLFPCLLSTPDPGRPARKAGMDAADQGELVLMLQGAGLPSQLLRPMLAKVAEGNVDLGDLKVPSWSERYSSCPARRPFTAPAWMHHLEAHLNTTLPVFESTHGTQAENRDTFFEKFGRVRPGQCGMPPNPTQCRASGAIVGSCICAYPRRASKGCSAIKPLVFLKPWLPPVLLLGIGLQHSAAAHAGRLQMGSSLWPRELDIDASIIASSGDHDPEPIYTQHQRGNVFVGDVKECSPAGSPSHRGHTCTSGGGAATVTRPGRVAGAAHPGGHAPGAARAPGCRQRPGAAPAGCTAAAAALHRCGP